MTPGTRQRLTQAAVLAVVVGLGVWGYGRVVRPDRTLLARYADQRLKAIFGDGVTYERVDIDLVHGVTIHGLEVRTTATQQPTLVADFVSVQHDLVSLASGSYVPVRLDIRGARWIMHETVDGVELDFPFHLDTKGSGGRIPEIRVDGAELLCRARPGSTRLRANAVIRLADIDLAVVPHADGRLRVEGSFTPKDLGHDDVRVRISGWADPDADRLDLGAAWNPLRLEKPLLQILAPDLAEKLANRGFEAGRLTVSLHRDPHVRKGTLEVDALWEGAVQMSLESVPGGEMIDARTREQLEALFRRAELDVGVSARGIDVRRLVSSIGQGRVKARGFISEDGQEVRLLVEVRGVRFEDPALRQALGPEGRAVFDQFEPTGEISADLRFLKEPGSEPTWEADVTLEDASFRYKGTPSPDGEPVGFPYAMEQATGRIHFAPGEVRFDDIVGFNGSATVRILGDHRRAWTGGETGRILLTDKGADIRLTIQATDVPVDETLARAIEAGELRGFLDRFHVDGTIEEIDVDVISIPGVDERAQTEVRVRFEDEKFQYADFPLPLEGVSGEAQLRRPLQPDGSRGRTLAVRVTGHLEQAPVSIEVHADLAAKHGRIAVHGQGVALDGAVADTVLSAPVTHGGLSTVWRYLAPRGRADVVADLPLADDPAPLRFDVTLHGASIRLDAEHAPHPLAFEDLTGRLRVDGDVATIEKVAGRLGETPVRVDGRIEGGPEGRWDLVVDTDRLRLDEDLLSALPYYEGESTLLPGGLSIEPGGHVAFTLHLVRAPGPDGHLEASVDTHEVDARLRLPGGSVLAVRGRRLAVENRHVTLEDLRGEARGVAIDVRRVTVGDGRLEGGFLLHLDAFEAPEDLLVLAPEAARDVLAKVLQGRALSSQGLRVQAAPDGSVRIEGDLVVMAPKGGPIGTTPRGRLDLAPLLVRPDAETNASVLSGLVRLEGLDLGDEAPVSHLDGEAQIERLVLGDTTEGVVTLRARGMQLLGIGGRDLVVPLRWHAGILRAGPIRGALAEGRLGGEMVAHTIEPRAYEGRLALDDFQVGRVREDLAPTGPPYTGLGTLWVRFENRGGRAEDLLAEGELNVRQGDLGKLPGVANLEALAHQLLAAPNPPRFERAHAVFSLRDRRLTFSHLDLAGPLFDMPGHGTVDLSGTADLEFTPDFLKSLLLPGALQLPGVGRALGALLPERVLYVVRVQGDLETAEPKLVPLPGLGIRREEPAGGIALPDPPARRLPRWFR